MLKRYKKDSEEIGDESTNKLMGKGIYRLEAKGKKRLKTKHYSFWSAVKSISLLSFFLWWLPTIGQIIAGYVGGRRAPSPLKAVLAAAIPVSIIFTIMYAHDHGILTAQISALYNLPSSIAAGMSSMIPFTAPYITFISNYLAALIDFLNSTIALWLNGFLVTIIFAYIGGMTSYLERNQHDYHRKFSMLLPKSLRRKHHVAYANVEPNSWYDRNYIRLDDMKKYGGQYGEVDRGVAAKGMGKHGHKAYARSRKAEPEDEVTIGKVEDTRDLRYPKEVVNKRLVARALSHYEHPKKRASKKRA